ncbi:MAG: HD domain-containing protein [Candidatus Pacebacteria bacterium]|nr:HD domain-containing protein [Candidatus Paceibacterota bacterium]
MGLQTATEQELLDTFEALCAKDGAKPEDVNDALVMMGPLRDKHPVYRAHYMHSLRVAIIARGMGRLWGGLDERALLFAGALHDIGKVQVPIEVLGKVDGWTREDERLVRRHVVDGYRMIRGRFDFSGGIMLWHHRFQANGYPKRMPRPLHNFANATQDLIYRHGRILSMADVYDALHRPNTRHGTLSGLEIKKKMIEYNDDRTEFVQALYSEGVLTVH